jgi:CRP-like cAMP-binding protein
VRPAVLQLDDVACSGCALGRASGADRGQFCPFIIRHHARDEILCLAGEPADHVWLVKQGVVGVDRSRDAGQPEGLEALRLPGSYIGLECLSGGRYLRTARALTPVALCGATRDGFFRWLRQDDERAATIMRAVLDDPFLAGHAGDLACRPGPGGTDVG